MNRTILLPPMRRQATAAGSGRGHLVAAGGFRTRDYRAAAVTRLTAAGPSLKHPDGASESWVDRTVANFTEWQTRTRSRDIG